MGVFPELIGMWQREFCGRAVSKWEASEAKWGTAYAKINVPHLKLKSQSSFKAWVAQILHLHIQRCNSGERERG